MGAFFAALFGIIYICIVLSKENQSSSRYEERIKVQKTRSRLWYDKVNNGPLNNYEFSQKIQADQEFCNDLFNECNKILESIPELDGIHMAPLSANPKNRLDKLRIMEMVYNARTGDVPVLWLSGWIYSFDFFCALPRRPSASGIRAFFKWYESELRKNGYPEATILAIEEGGFPVAWYFTDGATPPEQIRLAIGSK